MIPWIVPVPRLRPEERCAMLGLLEAHFEGVSETVFSRDLAEKQWAILLKTEEGALAGFSTVQLLDTDIQGRPHRFLFSGDTIVAPAYWNQPALAGSFGHLLLRVMAEYGEERLHWFLITKGYRTYRFLPLNFQVFHPAPGRPVPEAPRALLEHVARLKFGARFDAERGLIRADGAKDRLRPELCTIPEGRAGDAHVRFFLERNPDFAQGDELACLAALRKDNLTPLGWRQIERTRPRWVE
jgi:hypothetical protein